ncbi:hypothetical protein [Patulibacter minatonensis]|uniref:hypothetical protein n=1 Tax=Patulibacter minatonensis TaxID=298163 RepID=UPI00047A3AC3|nr:hypothetical protein [Patulibacter minatonensis]
MPPPTSISAFDPRFLRPCIFPVMRRMGYGTAVSVNNGIASGPHATDMVISLSVFDADGHLIGTLDDIGRLAPGAITKIDTRPLITQLGAPEDQDLLGVMHLVPVDLVGVATTDIDTAVLMEHIRVSDDFIEFRQEPRGVITGVAYQTGPLNDPRLSSTRTTVVQAPKVIVSEGVDTLFTLLNVSTSFDYADPVTLDFWIILPDGTRVTRSQITVPAWTYRQISVTEVLEADGTLQRVRDAGGLGLLIGYSKDGTVVPVSLTRNTASGGIACDHTLPPVFYLSTWGGQKRLEANARLEQELFDGDAFTSAKLATAGARS